MSDIFYVEASEEDVRAALEVALTGEEMAWLDFEERPKPRDPFEDDGRGEIITTMTVVIWTANAVAAGIVGGAAWDLTKKAAASQLTKKAWDALKKRFGDHDVTEAPAGDR